MLEGKTRLASQAYQSIQLDRHQSLAGMDGTQARLAKLAERAGSASLAMECLASLAGKEARLAGNADGKSRFSKLGLPVMSARQVPKARLAWTERQQGLQD